MKLSEGKLFTIESLNRIDGFEWPDGFKFAYMNTESNNHHHHPVFFCQSMPDRVIGGFNCKHGEEIRIKVRHFHIDFADSLISKEEFESVDGWVRHNNGDTPVADDSVVQVKLHFDAISQCFHASEFNWKDGDVEYWRYAKPQKQAKQLTTQPTHNIESLISKHKAARLSTLEARRQLEQAEAAEHSLLLSIEAWAESQGFDIRLLDDAEEKPELVITDWRDLQFGDVIWWSGDGNNKAGECTVICTEEDGYKGQISILIDTNNGSKKWIDTSKEQWKFIRRPAK